MVSNRRKKIPDKKRVQVLLWSQRHCCFCGKQCKNRIEIHHIDGNHNNNDIDNLILVCFDCHADMEFMKSNPPKGSKYREDEIKATREQYYRNFMSSSLRPVHISIQKDGKVHKITGGEMDVRCILANMSSDLPLRIRLNVLLYKNEKRIMKNLGDIYSGMQLINLNPLQRFNGHFLFPFEEKDRFFPYRVEIYWSIINIYNYEHKMLPFSYVLSARRFRSETSSESVWYFDPRVIKDEKGRKLKSTI